MLGDDRDVAASEGNVQDNRRYRMTLSIFAYYLERVADVVYAPIGSAHLRNLKASSRNGSSSIGPYDHLHLAR